jgi:hypothetical protein
LEEWKPRDFGTLRAVTPKLAEEARSITLDLIAALAAPFPHERWSQVPPEKLDRDEILSWAAHYGPEGDFFAAPVLPWPEVARDLQCNPERGSYQMMKRFLVMLSAAETFDSPFVYVGTLIAIAPLLGALLDFLTWFEIVNDEDTPGTWENAIWVQHGRMIVLFRTVFQIKVE